MSGTQSEARALSEWLLDLQEVEALHNFEGKSAEDLPFKKKDILTIIRQTRDPMWCYARNSDGRQGMIPLNYVKKVTLPTQHRLQQMQWFHGKISREEAESLLLPVGIDGLYLVRESLSYPGDYTLSVTFQNKVEHYHIKASAAVPTGITRYTLDEQQWFIELAELLEAYGHSREEGLCTVLRKALPKRPGGRPLSGVMTSPPALAPLQLGSPVAIGIGVSAIDPKTAEQQSRTLAESDLVLGEAIGKGEFGEVLKGSYRGTVVAVKKLKQDTRAAQSVMQEAQLMSAMKHDNLVAFIGIVRHQENVYIVTEYMAKGSLLEYLRSHQGREATLDKQTLIKFARDTCAGMAYLEELQVVHRDLAARNILISEHYQAKVSDFGLALYASEQREEDCDNKFPIKWTAPEALRHGLFTSKSDVWSFGILLWEIFTCGRNPYPRVPLADVTACVEHGYQNEQPDGCPAPIYAIMKNCWQLDASKRSTFSILLEQLNALCLAPV